MDQTSTAVDNLRWDSAEPPQQLAASVAFVIKIASASVAETHRRFLPVSSSTSPAIVAAADTSLRELAPETKAQLDSILEGVREELIEDGIANTITRKLPQLVANHYRSVLPAIAALVDGSRTSSAVTAEILKEVGRLRDATSHFERRWLLEHALWSRNPAARDGAGAGLAWLQDPAAAERVRAAAERETLPQLRADLEEVFRLLAATDEHGVAPQDHEG